MREKEGEAGGVSGGKNELLLLLCMRPYNVLTMLQNINQNPHFYDNTLSLPIRVIFTSFGQTGVNTLKMVNLLRQNLPVLRQFVSLSYDAYETTSSNKRKQQKV